MTINRFSVNPLGGINIGDTVGDLADTFARSRQLEAQQMRRETIQGLAQRASQGDADAVAELWGMSPELANMFEQRELQNRARLGAEAAERSKQKMTDFAMRVKGSTPESLEALLQEALADPEIDFDEEDFQMAASGNLVPFDFVLLNNMGEGTYKQLYGGVDDTRTSNQKDFDEYLRLKETDPEAAREFGIGAGFIKPGEKRLFKVIRNPDGTTTKYYSDGSEDVVSSSKKVKTPDMKAEVSQDQALSIIDKAKEGQLKNGGFALTLNDGLENIDSLYAKGYDPTTAAWVAKYLDGTTVGNLVLDADDQTFLGSVEQMINAIARRETGAAITAFERKDFFNRYMPAPGDTEQRKRQKRDALERQFKSIRGQSGRVYDALRVSQGMDEQETQEAQVVEWGDLSGR